MRPLHSLLFLLVIAALGLGGWLLISGDDGPGAIAAPLPESEIVRVEKERPEARLTTPEPGSSPEELGRTELRDEGTELATTEKSTDRMITGRILDDLGNPLRGVQVFVAPRTGIGSLGVDIAQAGELPWIRREEGRTQEDGRFEVLAPSGAKVLVAARMDGQAPLDQEFSVKESESHDVGDLVLERSVVLAGRVVDASGRGVEGAELRALPLEQEAFIFSVGGSQGGRLLATTTSGGAFRIDQLASGPYKILIQSKQQPDGLQEGTTERPGAQVLNLLWELPPGTSIAGRLEGAPAERLATTWIRAVPIVGEEEDFEMHLATGGGSHRTCEVREDGSFLLEGVHEKVSYRISAREGDQRFWAPVRSESVTATAGSADVLLQWRLEAALVFRVVDADTGAPVENFKVSAGIDWPELLRDEQNAVVKLHPEGRVRFGGLQADKEGSKAKIQIEAVGYQYFEREEIPLRSGEELELGTLRLQRVPLVLVKVVEDATGKPIARARVTLREQRENRGIDMTTLSTEIEMPEFIGGSSANSQTERTNKEGVATLSSFPDTKCELIVKRKGYADARQSDIRFIPREDTKLEIRMKSGGKVVVTVVDSRGEPVPGIPVSHKSPEDQSSGSTMIFMAGGGGRLTDSEGKKVFDHLTAGTHRFRIGEGGGGGFIMEEAVGAAVAVDMGSGFSTGGEQEDEWQSVEVAEKVTSELTLVAPDKGSLVGKVYENGKPLSGAKVSLQEVDESGFAMPDFGFGPSLSARTDGKGEFLIEGADAGEYALMVKHPTRAMPAEFGAELVEGANDIGTLELDVCIVEGRVTNQDGDPMPGIRVEPQLANESMQDREINVSTSIMISGDSGSTISYSNGDSAGDAVTTDAEGEYRLRGVRPDREIVISFKGEDLQPARTEKLILAPNDVRTGVDMEMREGGKLRVVGQRADGSAPGYCMVRAKHVDGEAPLAAEKNEMLNEGDVTLSGLAPGKWAVTLMPLDLSAGGAQTPERTEPREVEVVAGETAEVTIQIP